MKAAQDQVLKEMRKSILTVSSSLESKSDSSTVLVLSSMGVNTGGGVVCLSLQPPNFCVVIWGHDKRIENDVIPKRQTPRRRFCTAHAQRFFIIIKGLTCHQCARGKQTSDRTQVFGCMKAPPARAHN